MTGSQLIAGRNSIKTSHRLLPPFAADLFKKIMRFLKNFLDCPERETGSSLFGRQ
jgi:hypothetical protein